MDMNLDVMLIVWRLIPALIMTLIAQVYLANEARHSKRLAKNANFYAMGTNQSKGGL